MTFIKISFSLPWEESRDCYRVSIDENFLNEFEIKLLAGRNFSREMGADSAAVLLNSLAVKHLGFDSPESAIGETLNPRTDHPWKIIGVVNNYHQNSLKQDLSPVVFFYTPDGGRYFSLKINTNNQSKLLASIKTRWDQIYPDNPFDYFFLNDQIELQYINDKQFNVIFIGFAVLAIVACLGLFGLVSFTVEQSQKEIGIRKVLGASVQKMILLLASNYARLILISMVISFPIAYFLMQKWLMSFAYRTEISAAIFIVSAVLVFCVAMSTITAKSYRAATQNPVNVLRDE